MPPPDRNDDHTDGAPAPGPPRATAEDADDTAGPRRPLLMDPPGARRAGFAPPAALAEPTASAPGSAPVPGPVPGPVSGPARSAASPWAPGSGGSTIRPGRPNTPSRLAGPTPVLEPGGTAQRSPADRITPATAESSFGPVSRVVTVSVRTPSSRVDLALPDRTTIAEVLETVLEVAPRSLREQALAHGGWILRTAAGRPLAGSTTLLDERIGDGATLFLAGADTAAPEVVYDDVADALAEVVRADPGRWPATAGRAVAIGATAAFAVLMVLAVLTLGPPWIGPALALAAIAVATQALAALVARRGHDAGVALTLGLVSVGAGALAAVTAAAGSAPLTGLGPLPWWWGAVTAAVLAGTATLAIGARRTALVGVLTGAGLVGIALLAQVLLDLDTVGAAALVGGLAVCLMPMLPGVALRLAAFDPEPLPGGTDHADQAGHADLLDVARRPIDPTEVRDRTARTVRLLTGFVHGLAWPALAAGVVLAFAGQPAGPALATVVGAALLLRGRLFPRRGERLPLVLAGLGTLLAVPAGLLASAASPAVLVGVAVAAGLAAAISAVIALGRVGRSPARARAAEIIDLVLTIATIPLVAAVLGAFGYVRGLGG